MIGGKNMAGSTWEDTSVILTKLDVIIELLQQIVAQNGENSEPLNGE